MNKTTHIYEVQGAMRACKSIRFELKKLYKNSGFMDYDPEATVDDNINQLADNYCESPEKMIYFLRDVGSRESKNGGLKFTPQFVDLLLKWWEFPKTDVDQEKFKGWLNELLEDLESKGQISRIRTAITITGSQDEQHERRKYKEYVLYIVVKKELQHGDYYRCNMWACHPQQGSLNIMGETPLDIDTLDMSISNCIREYLIDRKYPSRVELVVPLNLMYELHPEKWHISDNGTLGHTTRVTLREYETLRLVDDDQIRRQDLRESFANRKNIKWISKWEHNTHLQSNDDLQANFIICHRIPTDINGLFFWLEKYPYMLLTRDDFEPETNGHKFLTNRLETINDDVPLQIRDIRNTCGELEIDIANSVAVVWDDGENNEVILDLVPNRRIY